MSIDFFNPVCQETVNDRLFGLCDDQDGHMAYTDTCNQAKWMATVRNNTGMDCVFTATDLTRISRSLTMNRISDFFRLTASE